MISNNKIGILGSGAWGTALANCLNKKENILLFKSPSNNMKITNSGDLQLAEHLIRSFKE